jgi:D-alanyl-D-alanine dipeptidase
MMTIRRLIEGFFSTIRRPLASFRRNPARAAREDEDRCMKETDFPGVTVVTLGAKCGAQAASAGDPQTEPPPDFVRLADIAPHIRQDMRYAGSENFLGRPVPGYCAAQCWLRREAAEALAAVAKDAEATGLSLVVYDCYRPQRATRAFIAWAADPSDQAQKGAYYPQLDKAALFDLGYIARESAHSTGIAVDLALVGLDFGTPLRHGFVNFDKEWWHFTLEGLDDVRPHDFEVR